MTKINDLYHCKKCHNLMQITHAGGGQPVCCGEAMTLLVANTTEASNEKHIPVIIEEGDCVTVKVGSDEHPMTDAHYIAFIEVVTEACVCRALLKPGDTPTAQFCVPKADIVEVRAFCNLHLLWKK
ncbi:MAG: desulfoferrodoxin FeS4 iron-binding domain-containing protein [Candidatus Cloacimonetes bacterium]|nr:desulfoferrodoxin FeS4 iron-binding domain-containing protein [Candidatus Cloacimonadota bacterium]